MSVNVVLSKSERDELEKTVRELKIRILCSEECFSLYKFVRDKTYELLYSIPRYHVNLNEELLPAFYLFIRKDCDMLISEYTITKGKKGYISFLYRHIMFRLNAFKIRQRREEIKEYALCAIAFYERREFTARNLLNQVECRDKGVISEEELKDTCKYIIHAGEDTDCVCENTNNYFSDIKKREDLLIYVFSTCNSLNYNLKCKLADLYSVDIEFFETISFFIEEEKVRNFSKQTLHKEEMKARYWLRYNIIKGLIKDEQDEDKRKELIFQMESVLEKLRQNQEHCQIYKGMSFRRIAELLGFSLTKTYYKYKSGQIAVKKLLGSPYLN